MYFHKPTDITLSNFKPYVDEDQYKRYVDDKNKSKMPVLMCAWHVFGIVLSVSKKTSFGELVYGLLKSDFLTFDDIVNYDFYIGIGGNYYGIQPVLRCMALFNASKISDFRFYTKPDSVLVIRYMETGECAAVAPYLRSHAEKYLKERKIATIPYTIPEPLQSSTEEATP